MNAPKLLLAALLAALAHAALAAAPARPVLPAGVAPCEGCHGARGKGNTDLKAPLLAAQSAAYLVAQLVSFTDGRRHSDMMTPAAQGLNADLRRQLAAYYAAIDAPPAAPLMIAPAVAGRGRMLATQGDNTRTVPACANCHGPGGIGESPVYPYLAGQQAGYLLETLKNWRTGLRKTDASCAMRGIAMRLSDDDLSAVADYFASLPPPAADSRP